jgi:4-carboxymuconolactone decarboxylase
MDEPTTRQQRFEHGWEVLSSVDGEAGERVIDSLSAIAPELVHQIVAWGYGEIYARPGLAPRDRQLVTLGILTALGDTDAELEVHIGAALTVGLTPEQIIEALLHSVLYCGFPRAINAVGIAKRVFAERGVAPAAS